MRAILEHGLTDSRQVYRHIKKIHILNLFLFLMKVTEFQKERKKERKTFSTP